jgi:hypothetical protein
MARISFIIFRNNYYKTTGGVIEESLKRGHQVNLLLDSSLVGEKIKGVPAPDKSSVPHFSSGVPNIVYFEGMSRLSEAACQCSDVVVLFGGAFTKYQEYMDDPENEICQFQKIRQASIPLISLNSHFYDHCLLGLDAFDSVDKTLLLSDHSVAKHKEMLLELSGEKAGKDHDVLKQKINDVFASKTIITGCPLFDFFDRLYEERKTSKQAYDECAFFVPKIDQHPFMQIIMREHPRWVSYLRSCFQFQGRYKKQIWKMPRVKELFKALNENVIGKGYKLQSKSRVKHGSHFDSGLEALSHRYYSGEEDEYYPNFTSTQVFQKAKFSIHMRTFSVLEAVLSGVPAINIRVPIVDEGDVFPEAVCLYVEKIRGNQPDTLFNFAGCVTSIPWEETLDFFAQQDFGSMEQDPEKREYYVQHFCGVDKSRTASEKQCDEIEKMV